MNIKVKIRNPKHSERVQTVFFSLGYTWRTSSTNVILTNAKYLFVDGGLITQCSDHCWFNQHNAKEIDLDWLIEDKPPIKVVIDGELYVLSEKK